MKKRILSVLLAALMIIGSVGTFAIGTAAAGNFALTVDVEKIDDDTVHVVLSMENNPGCSGINVSIAFDNTVIRPVGYDTVWNEVAYRYVMDTCLVGGQILTNYGGLGFDNTTAEEVTFVAVGEPIVGAEPYVRPSGKLIGFTFDILDSEKFTDLTITAQVVDQDNNVLPFVANNSHVGQLSLDDLTMASKTVTFDDNVHSLEIVGLDSEMTVAWTNNNQKNAGTYTVTAVVSKPGYNSKTLTATLTINKAEAKLTGVELWPAAEGSEDIKIKSVDAAAAEALGKGYPVVFNNAKVVKDGEVYKIEGVTVANTNIVLVDTTVVPVFVAEDDLVDAVITAAEIPATEDVDPRVSKITKPDVELPYGYELELVPNEVVDEDGSFEKTEDEQIVPVTFNVIDASGAKVGEVVVTYTIPKQATGSDLAILLLYYHKKMEAKNQVVETVKSDVSGATVAAGTKVTLSTATEGAKIHYTTDGSTATVLSPVYTGPIVVDKTVTISAIATKSGMKTSAPATFFYTVSETSIALKADAANIKYMEGRGDKFEPEAYATRYEVIKALANVFDIKTTNAPLALTDVADEYKELVDLCTAAGIIKGYEDKTFRGNEAITRAEVATMICNIMGLDVEGAKDAGFSDVSGWATKYVNACANAKYVNGNGDGTFAPGNNIKRNELTVIINNITGAKAGTSCSYADVVEGTWYFGYVAAAAK